MNEIEKKRDVIKSNIKGDFKLLWVALQRLFGDLFALIGTMRIPTWRGLPRFNWKWVAAVLLLVVLLVFLVVKCSNAEYSSVSINVEKLHTFGYKPSVQAPAVAHRVSNINYGRKFNDMNDTHLAVAKKKGIAPLASRDDVSKYENSLKELDDADAYFVDKLTHSVPYLVPDAADLLSKIGRNFQDSLVMKHLAPHKIIVTSVLRTMSDVKRLKKGNVNSSSNSAHCYATTFDISWKRYFSENGETTENSAKLTQVLGEVLRDLREQGCCYVKHEKKQACFHITVRNFPK